MPVQNSDECPVKRHLEYKALDYQTLKTRVDETKTKNYPETPGEIIGALFSLSLLIFVFSTAG